MVEKIKNNKGFILLLAIIISTIVLAIIFGVSNISLKEISFSTSAKNTNDAFFAADTGAECALFHDKASKNSFPLEGPATEISCFGNNITPVFTAGANLGTYDFTLINLGSTEQGCVKVNIVKDNTVTPMNTVITARGYNFGDSECNSESKNRVERKVRLSFDAAPPSSPFLPDTNNTLSNSLVAYWKLNEVGGIRDDSKALNNLTDNNTVTYNFGKNGNSGQFTKINTEYLSSADSSALSTGDVDFSMAGWVYLDSKPGFPIMAKYQAGNNREYWLGHEMPSDRFGFYLYNSVGSSVGFVVANNFGAPSTGAWYFIYAEYDAAANTIGISINNGAMNTNNTTGAPADTTSNFYLGYDTGASFDGRMDEFGFWKRTLTSQERTDLYNNGLGNTYN